MRHISNALGMQPDPHGEDHRCVVCGVLAADPDGRVWRNSIRVVDGRRVTLCEACAEAQLAALARTRGR